MTDIPKCPICGSPGITGLSNYDELLCSNPDCGYLGPVTLSVPAQCSAGKYYLIKEPSNEQIDEALKDIEKYQQGIDK